MRISDVLKSKGAGVLTVAPDATLGTLLGCLVTRNVGALVVVDAGRPVGIVSERDVVRHLHARGAGLLDLTVADIMSTHVVTCAPGDSVDALSALMTTHRVRHVPVVDDGALAGIVSIGDVVKTRMSELEQQQEHLENYIAQG
ncbi:CBS domain-containing protein [Mycolicibacterium grossiae]|uniref:Histidine kinase n=1 Tax=Mycolicibacterium grossiae TaxID=1552759 RepID=A0A1E8Q1S2_9MYCO|nr:CBS domain-containing protein [Mycolicibacterium grossiae]OFJ51950.1 histidine kinase [Mycolicibacterium grossiae]QEM47308.1 CBS domain-containing protein [Mycolicibacterium grossiae]